MFKFFRGNSSAKRVVEDWYEDRIGVITVQRNFLIFLIAAAFIALFISLFTLFVVTKSRNIEPFIIEISKRSGVATIVNPVTVVEYSSNRAVNNHFILEYVKARELFSPATYEYYYYTYVRLFSSSVVYSGFRSSLSLNNQSSPINLYSNIVNSKLAMRSIQYLAPQSVQLRFTLEFKDRDSRIMKKNKIATVGFNYVSLNMNEGDRYINPLGFVITSYQINDDYA